MTTMTTPHHQVATATAHMRGIADEVVDGSVWSMNAAETASTLVELTRLEAQVVELKARVAMHADEIQNGTQTGATSTATWLAHTTRQTRTAAYRSVHLGYDLNTHDLVRDGLAHGDLVLEQADVIIRAVKALPDDLDPDQIIQAERHLVAAAGEHDAKALRILGRRLLDVIAPDLADQHEADQLAKEEAKAAQAARFTMTDDGHGQVHGRFTLPTLQAAMLKKMLLALAAPKHRAATEGAGVERRPGPERMGRAFMELVERIAAKDLPKVGGRDATIIVTIDLDTLLGRLHKAGVLDTGERISPAQARRLACTARIIPIVLGGRSEVLDVGRANRFYTSAQQTAMAVRDGGCVAEGCDWPPWLCHAHHWTRWTDGGATDLANGATSAARAGSGERASGSGSEGGRARLDHAERGGEQHQRPDRVDPRLAAPDRAEDRLLDLRGRAGGDELAEGRAEGQQLPADHHAAEDAQRVGDDLGAEPLRVRLDAEGVGGEDRVEPEPDQHGTERVAHDQVGLLREPRDRGVAPAVVDQRHRQPGQRGHPHQGEEPAVHEEVVAERTPGHQRDPAGQ